MPFRMLFPLLLCVLTVRTSTAGAAGATQFVSWGDANVTWQERLALSVCAGLFNRPKSTEPAYLYNQGDVW